MSVASSERSAPGEMAFRRLHLTLVGALIVVVVRVWASWSARVPQVVADETAYLAMSRFLAGGPAWNLGESAPYMPLYSLVIAPGEVLGLSPSAVYRWAVVTNVALAGTTFVVMEALARRTTRLQPPWTTVAAVLATSLPALVLSTRLAWSDNLAPLCFALIALAGLRLLEAPTPVRAAAFALTGIAGYAAHSRFVTVIGVMAVALAVLGVRRALDRRVAAAAVAAMVGGVVLMNAVIANMSSALNMSGREASEFSRLLELGDLAMSILGQAWYLTVTTAGIAAFGGFALARGMWSTWRARVAEPRPATPSDGNPMAGGELLLLVGLIGISFATSAGFMTDRPRPDHLVYGRYNDMIVAPLVVLGLGALAGAWNWRRAAIETGLGVAGVALTAQLLWSEHLETLTGPFMPGTIMGLFALDPLATQRIRSIAVLAAGVIVLVAGLALVARVIDRPALLFGGIAALLGLSLVRATTTFERYAQPDPSAVMAVSEMRPDGERIVCAMTAGCPLLNFYRYQFYLPDHPIDLTWDESWREADVVLGGREGADAALLDDLGYELVWADPTSHGALWVR